ncbi:hypothetical protein BO71DRAFT_325288, partial [Aspergillus ellipticus CBS 707.79]
MTRPLQLASALSRAYPWTTSPLIISAPMRVMSGPALAVAVSRAGGLGFIGPNTTTAKMESDLDEARSLLSSNPIAIPPSSSPTTPPLPIGIGFQLWSDDLPTALTLLQTYQPAATWLFAPSHPATLPTWLSAIRSASPSTQIWLQIGTVSEAR